MLPAGSQPLSQKSRSEEEVAVAHGAVSGDGTEYLTLVTPPLSQASRGWPLTEAFVRLVLGCSCVEGAFGGDPDVSAFPGHCSGHPLSFHGILFLICRSK